jgi:glutathione S-transferase
MARALYELVGADPQIRFSPYCWRARMALLHKGIDAQITPWRFTDKEALAFSGQDKVPVLVDGDAVVSDSWEIARYLERTYPEAPSLFGGEQGEAMARFIAHWCDGVMLPGMITLLVHDIWLCLDPASQGYFRESREKRFGRPLEEIAAGREDRVEGFRNALRPMRMVLKEYPFLAGEAPGYADYAAFGGFMWARSISHFELLEPDDPVHAWRERMLDLYDGYARKAARVPA